MLDILSSFKTVLLEHKAAFFLGVLIASYPYIKKLDKKLKADKIKRKDLAQGKPIYENDSNIKGFDFSNVRNMSLKLPIDKIINVETLVFCNTDITDDELINLMSLSKLSKLDLSYCRNITDEGLRQMAKLANLKELSLVCTKITDAGLKYLMSCKSLSELDLAGCKNISSKGLESLKYFDSLQSLSIDHIKSKSFLNIKQTLSELNHIKYLTVTAYSATVDDFNDISRIEKLTKLNVFSCEYPLGAGMEYLCNLPNLQELFLDDVYITNDSLASISKITTLHSLTFQLCPNMTRKDLSVLGNLLNLTELGIYHYNWDEENSSYIDLMFLKELKNLKKLSLSLTHTTDDDCQFVISNLNSLHNLFLYDKFISDVGVQSLVKLENLVSLSLSYASITDKSLEYISHLKKLTSLDLSSTKINDRAISSILNMTNLKLLNLEKTDISAESIVLVKNCLKNTKVIH